MRIDIDDGNVQSQRHYLTSESLLKFFLGTDDRIDTLITCGAGKDLITTDYELYEALGSLKDDEFRRNKLVKVLERVDIMPFRTEVGGEKKVLTFGRVEELRALALKK